MHTAAGIFRITGSQDPFNLRAGEGWSRGRNFIGKASVADASTLDSLVRFVDNTQVLVTPVPSGNPTSQILGPPL